jgi:hypothetical protein
VDFRFKTSQEELVREFQRQNELYEQALDDPGRAQEELLMKLLKRSEKTSFGRQYDLEAVRSIADFQRSVPLHTYDELKPWVEQIKQGEEDVLFPGRPLYLAKTSGTSGDPKLIPGPRDIAQEYAATLGPFFMRMEQAFPGSWSRGGTITGRCIEGELPNGLLLCSASGAVRNIFSPLPFFQCAPEEVFEETQAEKRYLQLIYYMLRREELASWAVLNPSTLLVLFESMAKKREELAECLQRGQRPRSDVQDEPAPEAAARLRTASVVRNRISPMQVWPHLKTLCIWRSGGASHYLPVLRELCPGIEFWSMMTSSTESTLLVPIAQKWGGGAPAIRATFFEFFEADKETFDPVPIEKLEVGRSYRFAVTNTRGLFRYLMDDAFVVEGHHKACPILQFSHRIGQTSSLTGEKLTQTQVAAAVAAIDTAEIKEFQVRPHWGDPPFYVLTVELDAERSDATLQTWLSRFEDALLHQNLEYHAKRSSMRLRAPELWVLEHGAYAEQRRRITEARGRSDAQYKHLHLSRELLEDGDSIAIRKRVQLERDPLGG